ncbi:MAG: putative maltokinase, partial [Nitrospinae bacterium]|nr:putative maltokinase [Nitrospinota bacterium]
SLLEVIPLPWAALEAFVTLVQVEYTEGDPEIYVLPLTYAYGERAAQMQDEFPHPLLARLLVKKKGEDNGEPGLLYDALYEKSCSMALLDAIARHRRLKGADGDLLASPTRAFRQIRSAAPLQLDPTVVKAEQSNTSVVYGESFILKLVRRLEAGTNPDLEVGHFLTEKAAFACIPPIAGALEYRRRNGEPMTLAILQGFVPNQGDAWQYTLDALSHYCEATLAHQTEMQAAPMPHKPLLALLEDDVPALANELIGPYLASVRLLGQRTAELHAALAQEMDDPAFAPEPFSTLYQRSMYQSRRSLTGQVLRRLRERLQEVPAAVQEQAQQVLSLEAEILKHFRSVLQGKITAMRIRIHGDYHLGQVLYTGKDFVIIDFEGEPARSLSERRIKRCALRDVAGMLRSFHYACSTALLSQLNVGVVRQEDLAVLEPSARFWYLWVSTTFLKAYLATAAQAPFLPQAREELHVLLDAHHLEKAVYELGYELNNRPDWVQVPLQGILQLLETGS